ncbi:MAG: uL30 family ribosomal protein [Alphaproteobacteria bacterium]
MKLEQFLNKKIKVEQIKSGLKLNDRQKANLVGLGLRGIGSSSETIATYPVLGMIRKIRQLIKITN